MKTIVLAATIFHGAWVDAPPRYDYAFAGKVTVIRLNDEQMARACRSFVGCVHGPLPKRWQCTIYVNERYAWSMRLFRHEQAHCNGWKDNTP